MKNKADVVIIGGGISGCSIAYNLAKKGVDVVLLEKEYLTSGSTGRCGAGVRMQWGTEMNCLLAKRSIEFFEKANEILEYDGDVEFKQGGYLLLASTEKEMDQFRTNLKMQNALGINSVEYSCQEAKKLVPYLNTDDIIGTVFNQKDGHLNPFLATDAFAKAAKRHGAEIITNIEAQGIDIRDGKIVGVKTSKGYIETSKVVNAAGGYSKDVAAMAGVDIPVFSERHEILVTEPVAPTLEPMVMSFSKSFNLYCQQVPNGSFLMGRGCDEPESYNIKSSYEFAEEMAKTVVGLMPPLSELRVIRQWAGLYNITPDRQPIYGKVRDVEGFYLAAGFSGHGFMFAPITGEVISDMILGKESSIDVSKLDLYRFERGEQLIEPSVV